MIPIVAMLLCFAPTGLTPGIRLGSSAPLVRPAVDLCFDGILDGQETDVDCGGPTCAARCFGTHMCLLDSDCCSASCEGGWCDPGMVRGPCCLGDSGGCGLSLECRTNPITHAAECLSSYCSNGLTDYGESDVDCGSVCGGNCNAGKRCGYYGSGDGHCCTQLCVGFLEPPPRGHIVYRCNGSAGGGPCCADVDCGGEGGGVCSAALCFTHLGDSCLASAYCLPDGPICESFNWICSDGSVGSGCSDDSECVASVCRWNSCSDGSPGAPCYVDEDCISNSCDFDTGLCN
jgi:hypothetical protein